jgi:hypothetical protein
VMRTRVFVPGERLSSDVRVGGLVELDDEE